MPDSIPQPASSSRVRALVMLALGALLALGGCTTDETSTVPPASDAVVATTSTASTTVPR